MQLDQAELIEAVLAELDSPQTVQAFAANCYWPKWDGPWWKMLLLYELGEARRIPSSAADALIAALDALPLHTFPLTEEEQSQIQNPWLDTGCHCQVGTMFSVLTGMGRDVGTELPWMRSWLSAYQMPDGGLNCDEAAYAVTGECPSSMVATVAIGEALLALGSDQWTPAEHAAASGVLGFLLARKLTQGSDSVHNAEERRESDVWRQLCFPRFYHYDTLRGLHLLVQLTAATGATLAREGVADVITELDAKEAASPSGLRIERRCYEKHGTIRRNAAGEWTRGHSAPTFALLDTVSTPGAVSAALTAQWHATCKQLAQGL